VAILNRVALLGTTIAVDFVSLNPGCSQAPEPEVLEPLAELPHLRQKPKNGALAGAGGTGRSPNPHAVGQTAEDYCAGPDVDLVHGTNLCLSG